MEKRAFEKNDGGIREWGRLKIRLVLPLKLEVDSFGCFLMELQDNTLWKRIIASR